MKYSPCLPYIYDNLGRKTSMTPPAPAAATTYTYDALSNLLAVTVAGTPNRVTQYTCDMNGNKTSRKIWGQATKSHVSGRRFISEFRSLSPYLP